MSNLQRNILSTWLIGPATFFLAVYVQNGETYNWAIVLFVGFGICRYLRREIPKEEIRPFQEMSHKAQILSAIYYGAIAMFVIYVVLHSPEIIKYNDSQFLLLVAVLVLPLTPGIIRYELTIFKQAGSNVA